MSIGAEYSKKILRYGSPTKRHHKTCVGSGAQRKRASRETHDLSGNAQSDARTAGFGGEERDEDALFDLRRDGFAAVADFDDDILAFVEEGADLHPAVILPDSLHRVLEQIVEHPPHKVLIGVQ